MHEIKKVPFQVWTLGQRWCSIVLLLSMVVSGMAEDSPNIIIIYADELGFGDLSCYNSKAPYKTPHLDQMADQKTPEKPFFAVLSTQIAHAPVLPAEEFSGATDAGPRADFVWELDVLVGRVLDLVKELGIDEQTLVLFNSDNGAETVHVDWMRQDYQHDPSSGWRGMKRDGWEGGHRVPFIARWPGHISAGSLI